MDKSILAKVVEDKKITEEFDALLYKIGDKSLNSSNKKKFWTNLAENSDKKFSYFSGILFDITLEEFSSIFQSLHEFLVENKITDHEEYIMRDLITGSYTYGKDKDIMGKLEFLNKKFQFSWAEMTSIFAIKHVFQKELIPDFTEKLLNEFKEQNKQKNEALAPASNPAKTVQHKDTLESVLSSLLSSTTDKSNSYIILHALLEDDITIPHFKNFFFSPLLEREVDHYNKDYWDAWEFIGEQYQKKYPEEFKKNIQDINNLSSKYYKTSEKRLEVYNSLEGLPKILWHNNWFLAKGIFLNNFNYDKAYGEKLDNSFILDKQKKILQWGQFALGAEAVIKFIDQISLFKNESSFKKYPKLAVNIQELEGYMEKFQLETLVNLDKKPSHVMKL